MRSQTDRANWPHLLRATWVRPEDLHHYDDLFDLAKLATRMHDRPRVVIAAYAHRRFHGNLLNLLEPSHTAAFAPRWLDNDAFPADWFEHTAACGRSCADCAWCAGVLKQVLRTADEDES